MKIILNDLSERGKLFAISLIICIPSIIIAYIIKGVLSAILIAGFISFFLLLSRSIWRSKDYGKNRIIRYSIAMMVSAISLPLWQDYLIQLVNSFLETRFPEYGKIVKNVSDISPYFTLTLLAIFLLLINYWLRDKTGMVVHTTPLDEDFPEINYKQSFRRFCRVIKKTIEDIDLETNWSAEDFTPLDAEVEIRKKNGKKKKITDLLNAIKNDHETKVFLILGDPGSGKSVALRKLCKDLLIESEKTGKVPIYVNLKEWYVKEKWTKNNPPTSQQLIDFILNQLKGKDVFADEFLKNY